jgi:hypothetical protein
MVSLTRDRFSSLQVVKQGHATQLIHQKESQHVAYRIQFMLAIRIGSTSSAF